MTLVFGYGSNMDDRQMNDRCPNRETVGIAVLRDHRLHFPRYSNGRRCGVSSVEYCPGEVVWGVVHRLDTADLASLDASEGYIPGRAAERNGYNRVEVTVDLAGEETIVQTYIAVPTLDPSPPDLNYLTQMRNGAKQHKLPEEYQAMLAALAP